MEIVNDNDSTNGRTDTGADTGTDLADSRSLGAPLGGANSRNRILYGSDPLTAGESPRGSIPEDNADRREVSSGSSDSSSDNGDHKASNGGSGRKQRRDRYRKGSKREAAGQRGSSTTDTSEKGVNEGEAEKPPYTLNFPDLLKTATGITSGDVDVKALSKALQFFFLGPQFLGYGDHWPLTQKQADSLAEAWIDAFKSASILQSSPLVARLVQYGKDLLPLFSAAFVSYTVLAPRINKTAQMVEEKQLKEQYARYQEYFGRGPQRPGESRNPESPSNGATAEPGASAGYPPTGNDYSKFTN